MNDWKMPEKVKELWIAIGWIPGITMAIMNSPDDPRYEATTLLMNFVEAVIEDGYLLTPTERDEREKKYNDAVQLYNDFATENEQFAKRIAELEAEVERLNGPVDMCELCGKPIRYNPVGKYWYHTNTAPRHPAKPDKEAHDED
jgi:hypothetical protein